MLNFSKTSIFLLALIFSPIVFGQNCPEPKLENYKKVISSAFANDYKDCPVIIEGTYFKDGYAKGYRKPNKLNKMYFFQCLSEDGNPSINPLSKDETGDFFVIEKDLADKAIDLTEGDKVRFTGTTFEQNFFGQKLYIFFIVTDLEKI